MNRALIGVGILAMLGGFVLAAVVMLRAPAHPAAGPSAQGGERTFGAPAQSSSKSADDATSLAWLAGLLGAAGGSAIILGVGRWRNPRRRGEGADEYVNPSMNSGDDPRRVI